MAPVFEYVCLNGSGKEIKGVLDADDPAAARTLLRRQGLHTLRLVEVKEKRTPRFLSFFSRSRISPKEVAVVMRQFATLVDSGMPLVESLEAILEQVSRPSIQRTLRAVRERVLEGKALWQALSEHPRVFGELQVNMIRAGEASGALDLVLNRVADLMEAGIDLKNRVRSALAYPVLMFLVGSGVLCFLLGFVIPQVTDLFRETGQRLPWPTVLLMNVASLVRRFGWIALLLGAGGTILWHRFVRTPRGKMWKGRILLKIPVWGSLSTALVVSRFTRTVGTLLRSGMPLLSALGVGRTVAGNPVFEGVLQDVERRVGEGESLSDPLREAGVFPPLALHMIHAGEKSGKLEEMMMKVAETYEKEVTNRLALLMSLLEPLMILAMGLAVGFIVLSVLLPIFEMSQGIR